MVQAAPVPTEPTMHGFTYAQWMDPTRLAAQAQKEWDSYMAKLTAFEAVQNKEHWKGRIDAVIPADRQKITEEAIRFFAGSRSYFTDLGDGTLRVTAPGYWASGL